MNERTPENPKQILTKHIDHSGKIPREEGGEFPHPTEEFNTPLADVERHLVRHTDPSAINPDTLDINNWEPIDLSSKGSEQTETDQTGEDAQDNEANVSTLEHNWVIPADNQDSATTESATSSVGADARFASVETAPLQPETKPTKKKVGAKVIALVTASSLAVAGAVTASVAFFSSKEVKATPGSTPVASAPVTPGVPATPEAPVTPEASVTPATPESKLPVFDTEIQNKTFEQTQDFDFSLLEASNKFDHETIVKLYMLALNKAINNPDETQRAKELAVLYVDNKPDFAVTDTADQIQQYIENMSTGDPNAVQMFREAMTYENFMSDMELSDESDENFTVTGDYQRGLNTAEVLEDVTGTLNTSFSEWSYSAFEEKDGGKTRTMNFYTHEAPNPETGEMTTYWGITQTVKG